MQRDSKEEESYEKRERKRIRKQLAGLRSAELDAPITGVWSAQVRIISGFHFLPLLADLIIRAPRRGIRRSKCDGRLRLTRAISEFSPSECSIRVHTLSVATRIARRVLPRIVSERNARVFCRAERSSSACRPTVPPLREGISSTVSLILIRDILFLCLAP